MAIATITGPVYGVSFVDPFVEMFLIFELSHWEQESDVGVFVSGPVTVPVASDGSFSIDLFVNGDGVNTSHYKVFAEYTKPDSARQREYLGYFSLTDSTTKRLDQLEIITDQETGSLLDVYGMTLSLFNNAQGHSDAAAVSAAAALVSENSSAANALLASSNNQPIDFQSGLGKFRSIITGAPDAVADVTGYVTLENVTGTGNVARIGDLDVLNYKYLVPDECLMIAKGDMCTLTVRLRTVGTVVLGGSAAHVSMWFRELDESYDYVGTPVTLGVTLTSDWQDFTLTYVADYDGHCRGGFYVRNDITGSGFIDCQILDQHVMKKEVSSPYVSRLQTIDPTDTAFAGGCPNDGTGDWTENGLAINAALIAALEDAKMLEFGAGLFQYEASQVTRMIDKRDVKIMGQGSGTLIVNRSNAPLFKLDHRTTTLYGIDIGHFNTDCFESTYGLTRVISTIGDVASWTGVYESRFHNISQRGYQKFIEFDKTKSETKDIWDNTPAHGFNEFTHLHTPIYGARYPTHMLHCLGGMGPHCRFISNRSRVAPGGYAFEAGDGTDLCGDLAILNNLMIFGNAGVKLTGPSVTTDYSDKVMVKGNDVDGASNAIVEFTDIKRPELDNVALNGTPNDNHLIRCEAPNIRGLGAGKGVHGAVGKENIADAGDGTFLIWRIERGDTSKNEAAINCAVFAEIDTFGLAARLVKIEVNLVCNGGTWTVQNVVGPTGTSLGNFTIQFTPNGDGVDVQAVIVGSSSGTANRFNAQIELLGSNRRLLH